MEIHRVHLSLVGLEIPQLDSDTVQNELDTFASESPSLAPNGMSGLSTRRVHSSRLFAREPSRPDLDTTTEISPLSRCSQPPVEFMELGVRGFEPIELSIGEHEQSLELDTSVFQSQASCTTREINQLSSETPVQELPALTSDPVSDLSGLHQDLPRPTSSGAELDSATRSSQLKGMQLENIVEASDSPIQQRRPQMVTFNCRRPISCEGHCSCICHSNRRHYKSPGVLSKLVGSLFIGYYGLPVSISECDSKTCVNQVSRMLRVSYSFPTWFVSKTLNLVARNLFTSDPCFGLSLRNRVDIAAGVNIISSALRGDISTITKLLEGHKASLTDVESYAGNSPFNVCTRFQAMT